MRIAGKMIATGAIVTSLMLGGGAPSFANSTDYTVNHPDANELKEHKHEVELKEPTGSSHSSDKYKKRKHKFARQMDRMAEILGMTSEELRAELKAGKSLAEIAKKKGISEDQLIEKMKDSMTEDLRRIVNKKRLEPMSTKDNAAVE